MAVTMKCDSINSNEQIIHISDLIAFKISLSIHLGRLVITRTEKPYSVSMPNLLQLKAIYLPFPSHSIKKTSYVCVASQL